MISTERCRGLIIVGLSDTTQLAVSEPDTTQRDTSGSRVVEGPECPSGWRAECDGSLSAVEYVLVYNPAEVPTAGYGMGWTLIARHEGWRWSAALAARGAGAHAPARVAQAAAVRVLAEQGVAITGWSTGGLDN